MGLIDFLEGAYQGGRLLFLLYDHDKQVKLRYKAMKGRVIKRLSSATDNITRLREITPVNRPLVNPQSSHSTGDVLEDEIKASLAQGFKVTVLNDYIEVWCLRTHSTELRFITNHVETSTKLHMINQMKDNLIKQGSLLRSPLPNTKNRPLGYVGFGEVGHIVGKASESLIKASEIRKQYQGLSREEYNFLTQNLNEKK